MDLRALFRGTWQKVLRKCVPLCSPELAGRRIPALEALRCQRRGVAQLGSAGALGALGRRFESCRPDHSHIKGSRGSGDPSFLGFWGQCTENVRMTCSEDGSRGPAWVVVRAMYERRLSARERVLHPGLPQRRRPQNAPPSAGAGRRGVGPGSRSQSVSSKWGERAVASFIASLHRSR